MDVVQCDFLQYYYSSELILFHPSLKIKCFYGEQNCYMDKYRYRHRIQCTNLKNSNKTSVLKIVNISLERTQLIGFIL